MTRCSQYWRVVETTPRLENQLARLHENQRATERELGDLIFVGLREGRDALEQQL